MSEWQPIETAPKDGTPVLGLLKHGDQLPYGGEIVVVRYWTAEETAADEGGDPADYDGGWYEVRDKYCEWTPRHWMPLPEPPR